VQHSRSSLLSLRRRFAGLPETAHKQVGLRAIRDALRYVGRADMAAYVAEKAAWAIYQLPHAEAAR
jgi:hypothetical protein